jgi:monoamine oxidase
MATGSAAPDPVTRGPFDIAIIGAGAAGISAARVCREKPVSYVVIEARDRIGGRAWSDNSFTAPADLGAEWFILITPNPTSSLATNNPLFERASLTASANCRCSRRAKAQSLPQNREYRLS